MQERKILVRGVQNAICFPRYAEIKSQVQNGDRFVYLFAVGKERFFLYQQHQYKEREELNLMHLCWSVENQRKNSVAEQTLLSEEEIVFHYETTRYLRGAAPQHMCYAGLVGAQLAGWYAAPVSYTHLDVYKRQPIRKAEVNTTKFGVSKTAHFQSKCGIC